MLAILTGVHPGNGCPWENQLPTCTATLKYQRLQTNVFSAPCRISSRQKSGKRGQRTLWKENRKKRTYTGYNVWSPETFRLFEVISNEKYLVCGFTNRDIRREIYDNDPDSTANRGKTSRTFAKLRAHGVIRKIPHSRRYLISDKGRRVLSALIEAKRKTYPELAVI